MGTGSRFASMIGAIALLSAACADGQSSAEGNELTAESETQVETDPTDGEPDHVGEIRLVVPAAVPLITGTIALGIAEGVFEQVGVDVELEIGAGAQATNAMVAGQADLTEAGVIQASSVEKQGKDVSVVWANSGGGLGLSLYSAGDGPESLRQFQNELAGDCVFGVTTLSGTDFGYATLFNQYANLDCEIIELGDRPQILGALSTGRIDLMVGTGTAADMIAALEAGKIQELLSFDDPEWEALNLPQFPERVLFGLADNLNAKRDVMVAFTSGMIRAAELYDAMTSEEIADAMLTVPAVKDQYPFADDKPGLVKSIEASKPFINWSGGYISDGEWSSMLTTIDGWGVDDFEAQDPVRSYENIVDMTFYDESAS